MWKTTTEYGWREEKRVRSVCTNVGPDWFQAGSRLGPDWFQAGSRLGPGPGTRVAAVRTSVPPVESAVQVHTQLLFLE